MSRITKYGILAAFLFLESCTEQDMLSVVTRAFEARLNKKKQQFINTPAAFKKELKDRENMRHVEWNMLRVA